MGATLKTRPNDKEIYNQTLNIPHPYEKKDALWWFNNIKKIKSEQGCAVTWAIRDINKQVVGGVGFHDIALGKSHCAEIGYWLAKKYWGQGIMTAAVKTATDHAFNKWKLIRIIAGVFHFNQRSARVLEKNGYELEGTLRSRYRKDGKVFDGKLYSKIKNI